MVLFFGREARSASVGVWGRRPERTERASPGRRESFGSGSWITERMLLDTRLSPTGLGCSVNNMHIKSHLQTV